MKFLIRKRSVVNAEEMNTIKVMMVDDEPLIRKAVKMEMNARAT